LGEIKLSMYPNNTVLSPLLLISLFIVVIGINFMALFPFIFTPTAHMILTFPLTITVWRSLIFFGWFYHPKAILAHMVPSGTPTVLMFFMVLIELVRNIIRPLTLSVRLSANIIAGHLLICLLGNFLIQFISISSSLILIVPVLLSFLELGVSIIQAYVIMTLITLYITEIH